MTGYEIYDEGYEAGYESAMADIMEAMEAKKLSPEQLHNLKDSLDHGSFYSYGKRTGKMHAKADHFSRMTKKASNDAIARQYQRKSDSRRRRAEEMDRDFNTSNASVKSIYGDDIAQGMSTRYNKGKAFGEKYGDKRYHKKANEALFDFDDIDHAYLDDEYDDFDYE